MPASLRNFLFVTIALPVLAAHTAAADVLASASRVGNFTTTDTSPVPIPLNAQGATSLAFTTTKANDKVVIVYNAECGVVGNPGNWVTVIVKVDGVAAAPASTTSFALCTATSTTTYAWVGAVRQAVATVATPGVHRVTVTGQLLGATGLWLGDSSIVVSR